MNLNPGDFRLADPYSIFKTAISATYSPRQKVCFLRRGEHWTTNYDNLSLNHKNLAVLYTKYRGNCTLAVKNHKLGQPKERRQLHQTQASSTTTHKIDSPLDRRKQELVENVSFLEVQISSAEDHLAKLKGENDLLQIVSRGRICSHYSHSIYN